MDVAGADAQVARQLELDAAEELVGVRGAGVGIDDGRRPRADCVRWVVVPTNKVPLATGWVRAASRQSWRVMPASADIARAARSFGIFA